MSGKFLVKSKGSLQLVESLDGYPRAAVLAEGIPDPPHPESRLENGVWIEPDSPPPTVEERLAKLEADLAAMKGPDNAG